MTFRASLPTSAATTARTWRRPWRPCARARPSTKRSKASDDRRLDEAQLLHGLALLAELADRDVDLRPRELAQLETLLDRVVAARAAHRHRRDKALVDVVPALRRDRHGAQPVRAL